MNALKTLLLFVLSLTLAAAAVFTRPSKASLKDYLVGAAPRTAPSIKTPSPTGGLLDSAEVEAFLDDARLADRVLWVDVYCDGKICYTGAFGHWFPRTPPAVAKAE